MGDREGAGGTFVDRKGIGGTLDDHEGAGGTFVDREGAIGTLVDRLTLSACACLNYYEFHQLCGGTWLGACFRRFVIVMIPR